MMHDGYFFGMKESGGYLDSVAGMDFFIPYPSSSCYQAKDEALEVLRQRFAKGE
ncbi:MAG: SHOCT domain-containing protein [Cyclobacteriaceae bacterium]